MSGPISIGDLKTTFAGLYQNDGNSLSDYYGITFSDGSAPASGTISLGDFLGKTPSMAEPIPPYTILSANNVTLTDSNPKYFTFQRQDSSDPPITDTVHAPTTQFTEQAEFTTELPGFFPNANKFLLNTFSTTGDSIAINPENPPSSGDYTYVYISTPGHLDNPYRGWSFGFAQVTITYSP